MLTPSNPVPVVTFAIIVVLLGAASIIGITQQEQERLMERQSFSNEPVRISVVKTKKGVIKLGEKFNNDNEWFKGLKVIVENVSDKPVTYVRVGIIFHRPKSSEATQGYPYGESLTYGVDPFSPEGSDISNQAKAIAAGKSIELVMPDEVYSGTKAVLKELKFPESIKRIEITVETVGFEDGTAWSAGQLWRRDIYAPRGWSPVEKSQGRALNRTAKFLRMGFSISKSVEADLSHKASWLEPLAVQLPETQCGQVEPEWYSQCGAVAGCRFYNSAMKLSLTGFSLRRI